MRSRETVVEGWANGRREEKSHARKANCLMQSRRQIICQQAMHVPRGWGADHVQERMPKRLSDHLPAPSLVILAGTAGC